MTLKVVDTANGKAVENTTTTVKTESKFELTQELNAINRQIESLTNLKKSLEFKLNLISEAETVAEPIEEEIK